MSEFAPCPQCGSSTASRVGFTWWGGIVGPKLLTHVRCGQCRATYNGKTGASNTTGIVIYFVVTMLIAVIALGWFWSRIYPIRLTP